MRPDPPAPKGEASDWFGYVHEPISVDFGPGRIEPVENYSDIRDWVVSFRWLSEMGNKQGTLHPPIAKRCVLDLNTHVAHHPTRALCPPSTGSTTPVMNPASSECRNKLA